MTRQASKEAKRLQLELPLNYGQAITDDDIIAWLKLDPLTYHSRRQIALGVGRKVTPSLVERMERLVRENKIVKEEFTLRNGAPVFGYMLGYREE